MDNYALTDLILAQEYLETLNQEDKELKSAVFKHIDRFKDKWMIPEFSQNFQWINTDRSLVLNKDLKGKILVLDFFTYCCINCMHILPDLEALELQFPIERGVVIVGVHSAKFENEKIHENVVSAVVRNNIHHPVINDSEGELWDMLSVSCWPTLFILGPTGQILFTLVGEGHKTELFKYVTMCLEYFEEKNEISRHSLPVMQPKLDIDQLHLKFPGKVCCSNSGSRVAIADTGHHRILIVTTEGLVQHCVGGKVSGFVDGDFMSSRFHSPQGITWRDEMILFVADTENHAIRKIDLSSLIVTTTVGNGEQGDDRTGGKNGTEQSINSPWDVCIGSWNFDLLIIAMAGLHQLWGYALENTILPNGKTISKHSCLSLVGSGNEENRNNRYPHKASFAQPSGLCFAVRNGELCLIVADSESSTIRSVDLKTFGVTGIVGGGLDPKDLFIFGDKDGIGNEVKLQHPLGVAWDSEKSFVYIADSYNNKIKILDIVKKTCITHQYFHANNYSLKEPGGIDTYNDRLFIADTNSHKIVVLNLKDLTVREMKLIFMDTVITNVINQKLDTTDAKKKSLSTKPHLKQILDPIEILPGGDITFEVSISLDENLKTNNEATNTWCFALTSNSEPVCGSVTSGTIKDFKDPFRCHLQVPLTSFSENYSAVLECKIFFCDSKGRCHFKIVHFEASVTQSESVTVASRNFTFLITL